MGGGGGGRGWWGWEMQEKEMRLGGYVESTCAGSETVAAFPEVRLGPCRHFLATGVGTEWYSPCPRLAQEDPCAWALALALWTAQRRGPCRDPPHPHPKETPDGTVQENILPQRTCPVSVPGLTARQPLVPCGFELSTRG